MKILFLRFIQLAPLLPNEIHRTTRTETSFLFLIFFAFPTEEKLRYLIETPSANEIICVLFLFGRNSTHLYPLLVRWPEEKFSFRRHACRLCVRNKIQLRGRARGQSSLQNSNLITLAFESGTKDEGERRKRARERERERERERKFSSERRAQDQITDST